MYSNYTFEIRKLNNKIKMKEKFKMSNIFEKKIRINELTNLRKELMQQGNVVEEVKVLKELAELTQEVFGEESDENIKILNEVGGTLKYVGEFDTAKDALLKAQGFIEKKYDDIENIYLNTMKIYESNNLQNDYVYASVCNNLALFYQELERYEEAIELQEKSLEILEKVGENPIQYAITLSNLVQPYLKVKNKEKAEEYLQKSLELIEKEVGKTHNLYAAVLNNMATFYFAENEYEKALELFEESAEICEKTFGKESNNYKNILENIEVVKEKMV